MATRSTHPYVPSAGTIVQAFTQFRKAMPSQIDAATLKRLAIAPSNESVVIGVLRFLGFVDPEGKRTDVGKEVFLKHNDGEFAKALETHVKTAYSELFDLRGNDAWRSDRDNLIAFFRATDETSALTATRQAVAFETLAALSGQRGGDVPASRGAAPRASESARSARRSTREEKETAGNVTSPRDGSYPKGDGVPHSGMALTVRIEVNLPAQADQDTYDRIFKSIRANLLK